MPDMIPREILSSEELTNRPITLAEEVRRISGQTVKGSWMLSAI
jgi:hypothetical protein